MALFSTVLFDYKWLDWWGLLCLVLMILISFWYAKRFIVPKNGAVTKKQTKYFFTAIVLFYLFKGSPYTIIADDFLFSAHVFGLSVMLFFVPPLLILGMPKTFLRSLFWNHRMKYALGFFSHPWLTAIVFNGFLTIYLVPSVFNTVHEQPLLSFVFQAFLLVTSCLMWWTIIAPIPEMNKFSDFVRIAYVFLTAILLMPIGFFLLLTIEPHFLLYLQAEEQLIPALTAVYDQQLAGGLLKAVQLSAFGVALYYLIFNWARKEEEKEGEVDDENIRVVQGIVIHLQDKK